MLKNFSGLSLATVFVFAILFQYLQSKKNWQFILNCLEFNKFPTDGDGDGGGGGGKKCIFQVIKQTNKQKPQQQQQQ